MPASSKEPEVLRVWVNGEDTHLLPVFDRGLSYGDGIFTTAVYKAGKIQLFERHLKRMHDSGSELGLQLDEKDLVRHVQIFLDGLGDCILKIILTRQGYQRSYHSFGHNKPNIILQAFPLLGAALTAERRRVGVDVFVCDTPLSRNKLTSRHKHLNKLENVLARSEQPSEKFPEGIMLDTEGNVVEGTMSNIFLVTEGVIQTPDLTYSGVEGVMRSEIIGQSNELQIPVEEKNLSLEDLNNADEVFLSNSIIGIWPISSINDKKMVKLAGSETF